LVSGYWLLTARGDESKVEKAQATIRRAVIGMIIVLAAYSITQLVTAGIRGSVSGAGSSGKVCGFWRSVLGTEGC
jgi:hypothetical protein